MKKTFFYIIIYAAAILEVGVPASAKVKGLPCNSGGICVAIQEGDDGLKVAFNDFVHINPTDGYFMRIIENKDGVSGPTQVQNAISLITEVDQTLGKAFETAAVDVQKVDARKIKPGGEKYNLKKGEWVFRTLAIFNPSRKKFVVDTSLYGKLSPSDTAGVIMNMACVKVAKDKNIPSYQFVNCEKLVRRLFCDDDCYKSVAEYTQWLVPSPDARKAKIKYFLGLFVPPVNSNPVNTGVDTNLARGGNPNLNTQTAVSSRQGSQPPQIAQTTQAPVVNNMPPIPPTPAGANPWIAPQYQQQQQNDAQAAVPAPVPGSDMTGVQQGQVDPQAQQQQQSAEVQMPASPDGQVQQQQQPPPGT